MPKARFMSLVFLAWSIAFFLMPGFRQGLQMPILGWSLTHTLDWLTRAGRLSPDRLEKAAAKAEQDKDARTLAFVALHSPDSKTRARLAEEAVAIDKSLSWIYVSLYFKDRKPERPNPKLDAVVKRLQDWDPDNALPYLLEGSQIALQKGKDFPTLLDLDALARETAWREAMHKAFTAPRYNSYNVERFDLERNWLHARGLDRPAVVLLSVANYPTPDMNYIRMYAELMVKKLGRDAEEAKQPEEAASDYWTVAHMGERMENQGSTLLESLIGSALQMTAYERLIPLLGKMGRPDEAATVRFQLRRLQKAVDIRTGKDPLAQSSNYNWAALTVHVFAGFVVGFGLLTAVSMIYVNLKRWLRPEKKGRVFQILAVVENYAPVLLFFACAGLNYTYYPFAENFRHYMTATGPIHDLEPLFFNTVPVPGMVPGQALLPLGNPFVPYAWYGLAGLVIVVLMVLPFRRRA